MPERSDPDSHPTPRLIEGGETLQTLTPPTLATLQILIDYDISTQSEMADVIGCSRPSVSRYLQSLEDSPIPLARKQGQHYTATEFGEQVFGLIESMLDRLGTNLGEIEWSDDNQDDVENNLSPLHDSRSTWPFLILDTIREQGDLNGSLGTSPTISAENIVVDVRARQQDLGKTVAAKQIRKILWRFDETGAVEFDGGEVTLTTKGQEHARLLHQLIQALEEFEDTRAKARSAQGNRYGDTQRVTSNERSDSPGPDKIATLFDPRAFRGGSQSVSVAQRNDRIDSTSTQTAPTIVPAYYLCSSEETEISVDQTTRSSPMLPFTSLTVEELTHFADQLDQAHDGDAQLEPYWALRTDDGLFPLGPAQLTIGHFEDE